MADVDIVADLQVRTKRSEAAIRRLSKNVDRLSRATNQVGSSFRVMKGVLGAMATSGALQALGNGMRRLVRSATEYHAFMDRTRIGLRTIMGQVEKVNGEALGFARAGALARQEFEKIRLMAVRTTATTGQMFETFQGVYGPLRAAGMEMDKIREITQNSVYAAGALGVDLKQAGRDIQLMARGTAGMDTKLFVALRSMNAITASTKEFNQALPEDRAEMIRKALSGFEQAGDAAAASWGGVTSTFQGITEELTNMFFAPTFTKLAKELRKLNDVIIKNWIPLKAVLTVFGQKFRDALMGVVSGTTAVFKWLVKNWDIVTERIHDAMSKMERMMPMLKILAGVFVGIKGFAIAAAGFSALIAGGTKVLAFLATTVEVLSAIATIGVWGTITEVFAWLGTALSGLLWPLTVMGGLITFIASYWMELSTIMSQWMPIFQFILAQFYEFGGYLWQILRPILKVVGAGIMFFIGALGALITTIVMLVMPALNMLGWFFSEIFRGLEYLIDAVIKFIFDSISAVMTWLGFDALPARQRGERGWFDSLGDEISTMVDKLKAQKVADEGGGIKTDKPDPTNTRKTTVNDFRGSKIEIKQDFRQADPDRIAAQMMNDITKYAAQRIQSGYAPPFGY